MCSANSCDIKRASHKRIEISGASCWRWNAKAVHVHVHADTYAIPQPQLLFGHGPDHQPLTVKENYCDLEYLRNEGELHQNSLREAE